MRKEDLLVGHYYAGLNRLTFGIGLWTGDHFVGYGYKFGQYVSKSMDYYPEIPYHLIEGIDPNE